MNPSTSGTSQAAEDPDPGTGDLEAFKMRFPETWARIAARAMSQKQNLPKGFDPSDEPAYGFDPRAVDAPDA